MKRKKTSNATKILARNDTPKIKKDIKKNILICKKQEQREY